MKLFSRTRFILAPPGVDPLAEPIEDQKRRLRLGTIFGVFVALSLCASTYIAFSGSKRAQAQAEATATAGPAMVITDTPTLTPTIEPTAAIAEPTQTPWVITEIITQSVQSTVLAPIPIVVTVPAVQTVVVQQQVPGPVSTVLVPYPEWVYVTVDPGPTQTPWVITATPAPTQEMATPTSAPPQPPVIITVEVPVYITPEPGPTQTPWVITATPSPTPEPTEEEPAADESSN